MIAQYKYTDAELKQILKTLTVIVDTREKENEHILNYLSSKKIPYIEQALSFGDYSYMLPACPELGIGRDMYFTNDIVVERKASLEELSGNLAQKREQFENEFLRARDCDITLLVERGSLSDIYTHKYQTELKETAFMASLLAWEQRYGIKLQFVHMTHSGQFIYGKFYYHLREILK